MIKKLLSSIAIMILLTGCIYLVQTEEEKTIVEIDGPHMVKKKNTYFMYGGESMPMMPIYSSSSYYEFNITSSDGDEFTLKSKNKEAYHVGDTIFIRYGKICNEDGKVYATMIEEISDEERNKE